MSSRRALVIGLGLIGGSIGKRLRARGWHVAYVDPHVDDPGDAADERGMIADAVITIVATTVDVAIPLVRDTKGLVTSVCSVMAPLRAVGGANFVAGHPLAGSAQRGLAAADAHLFEGRSWFIDRDEPLVREVAESCGAIVEVVDAGEHDRSVALTSHLPQILSTAFAAYLEDKPEALRFAGPGLQTFLRLAGSDAYVWAPVIESNRANIAPHAEALAELVREMIEGDPADAFRRAQHVHAELTAKR
jgi:prephenate dehydrogenase